MRHANMTNQPEPADRRAHVLLAAREIIQESGTFDLPMRDLAARARVSMRAPYKFFGSKSGVIQAILYEDVLLVDNQQQSGPTDPVDQLFDRLRLGINLYRRNQPFYRALFREAELDDSIEDAPATINLRYKRELCERMDELGIFTSEASVELLAESLRNQFFAQMRLWANGGIDIEYVHWKIIYGWSTTLSGVTTKDRRESLAKLAKDALRNFSSSQEAQTPAVKKPKR